MITQKLKEICLDSLNANLVKTVDGEFFAAGSHQFKTLWTRDFCFSVNGLIKAGHLKIVQKQIDLFINYAHPQTMQIPRGIDAHAPQWRVLLNTAGRFLPTRMKDLSYSNKKLKAEYLGEHQTVAFDSNILILLASAQVAQHDLPWFEQRFETFKKVFAYYGPEFMPDKSLNLFYQPGFSDWQDSARREGYTSYFHLLYLIVLKKFAELGKPLAHDELYEQACKKLTEHFRTTDAGLICLKQNSQQAALETQLWALEYNILPSGLSQKIFYKNIQSSKLWQNIPGIPVYPPYSNDEISWTTKAVGLRHYHDQLHWSWLMGESIKIADLMNDDESAHKLKEALYKASSQENKIHEVYQIKNGDLKPFKSPFYRSEAPFTWGACKILEAL